MPPPEDLKRSADDTRNTRNTRNARDARQVRNTRNIRKSCGILSGGSTTMRAMFDDAAFYRSKSRALKFIYAVCHPVISIAHPILLLVQPMYFSFKNLMYFWHFLLQNSRLPTTAVISIFCLLLIPKLGVCTLASHLYDLQRTVFSTQLTVDAEATTTIHDSTIRFSRCLMCPLSRF